MDAGLGGVCDRYESLIVDGHGHDELINVNWHDFLAYCEKSGSFIDECLSPPPRRGVMVKTFVS